MDFYERTKKLCKEQNITVESLMATCGLGRETFSKWKARDSFPRADNLYDMSKTLGVTMEYLLTGEKEQISEFNEYISYLEKASAEDIYGVRKLLGMPEKKTGSSGIKAS